MATEIGTLLLGLSDSQLDAAMHPLIQAWSDPPSALQLLEVLDKSIHGSLGSSFVIKTLQVLYDAACKTEGITHEEVAKSATWRGVL